MSFQSYLFPVFLAAAVAGYYAVPARLRTGTLLLANLIFFCFADWRASVWLALAILATWGTGLLLGRVKGWMRRGLPALCLLFQFAMLALFRYLPVWEGLINARLYGGRLQLVHLDAAAAFGWAAPLGISFYTLEAAGYVADVYRGRCRPERSLLRFAVFLSFFPNLASGPIERAEHFFAQLDRNAGLTRRALWDYDRFLRGLVSILLGFFLKMVVADRAAIPADLLYGMYADGNSFTMLMAVLFYAVQLYCDFCSYSLIAVGAAQLFGFELTRNFRQPYLAEGFSDFWRRWHISLSSWLRDYVYIPLGGNRKGAVRKYANLLLVFAVSGLWHGGAPTFLVWGLLHGLCQVLEDLAKRCLRPAAGGGRAGAALRRGLRIPLRFLRRLFTFLAVSLLWVLFRSDTLEMAAVCYRNLFTRWQGFLLAREFLFAMGLDQVEFGIFVGAALFVFLLDLISEHKKKEAAVWLCEAPAAVRFVLCLGMLLAVFVVGEYGSGYDASRFIYMGF